MHALQAQLELVSNFSTSVMSTLQAQANLVSVFPASIASDLQAQMKLASNAINSLPPTTTMDYFRNLAPYYGQLSTIDFANQITATCNYICNAIKFPSALQDRFDFLKKLNFQEDFIELTEDDCNSINFLLESSYSSNDEPKKVSKGKMAVADFIKTVLIPILAILLPMLLTIYYHKIDSIESEKRHIEELQLKEKELQQKEEELLIKEQQLQNDIKQTEILKNILIEIQSFPEYLESLQVVPECPCVTPKLPGEVPEPFDEAPRSPGDTQDNDLLSPDVSKSLESATHKE